MLHTFCEITNAEDIVWTQRVLENLFDKAFNAITKYGGRVVIACLFIFIGFKLTKFVTKILRKTFELRSIDASVSSFLLSLITIVLKVLVLLTAVTIIGIQMTSFITLLGTAGIAVGLALQGSLTNLVGGVLVLMMKPYKIGDYIKVASGNEGTVSSIDIFYTKLKTVDNQVVVIPNGELSNSSITNVTKAEFRRVDLEVDIAYDSDIKQVKAILHRVINEEKRVDDTQSRDVFVSALGESSIVMGIRVWVKTEDYWNVRWSLLESIKYAFDREGVEIPYKTVDVNLLPSAQQEEHA